MRSPAVRFARRVVFFSPPPAWARHAGAAAAQRSLRHSPRPGFAVQDATRPPAPPVNQPLRRMTLATAAWALAMLAALAMPTAAPAAAAAATPAKWVELHQAHQEEQREHETAALMLTAAAPTPARCGRIPAERLEALQPLSPAEQEAARHICWPEGAEADVLAAEAELLAPMARRGVPPGVNCSVVQWCAAGARAR